jgi:hypothetical protein
MWGRRGRRTAVGAPFWFLASDREAVIAVAEWGKEKIEYLIGRINVKPNTC